MNHCRVINVIEFRDKLNSYKELKNYITILNKDVYTLKGIQSNIQIELASLEKKMSDFIMNEWNNKMKQSMNELMKTEKDIKDLESKSKYPIILDDAFIQYDDKRLKNILDFLLQYCNRIQIIIFTCQCREYEYLKDKCNYIKL